MTLQRFAARRLVSLTTALCLCLAVTSVGAGQYAKISDDLQLYYEDVGQGPVMVWVPGWTASTTVFSHQIEYFSKRYRVVAYDPRSQGLSTHTLDHNDYAQHGRDLAGFVDKLGLKDVILVAWSWGCLDAYSYIRARGTANLKAFICIDQAPKPLNATADEWAGLFTLSNDGLADMHGAAETLGANPYAFFRGFFPGLNARKVTPAEVEWFTRQAMLTPTHAALSLFYDANLSDYVSEARSLDGKVPVLNVVNEIEAPKADAWLKQNARHSAVFVIKLHMSHWSDPATFNHGVDAFLKTVK
ncbi:alpha/beta hydrolase [Caballeronia sp. GACF5]|uniref:alpha/beta fold hydrolase n=1 Tax=Caballeronia sp. GACF5 TaxID=2921746 RepID=UPI002028E20C|nr:alpha/beta hydrolase [Caballeronia sp. GACF5]